MRYNVFYTKEQCQKRSENDNYKKVKKFTRK